MSLIPSFFVILKTRLQIVMFLTTALKAFFKFSHNVEDEQNGKVLICCSDSGIFLICLHSHCDRRQTMPEALTGWGTTFHPAFVMVSALRMCVSRCHFESDTKGIVCELSVSFVCPHDILSSLLALKASSAQESCLLTSGNCDHDLS
jgi:hypothetical protein